MTDPAEMRESRIVAARAELGQTHADARELLLYWACVDFLLRQIKGPDDSAD